MVGVVALQVSNHTCSTAVCLIRGLVPVLAAPFQILRPAKARKKAPEDVPSTWAATTHMGDQNGVPDS